MVSFEKYLIKKEVKCSTPVHKQSRFLPNFSTGPIQAEGNTTHINETDGNSYIDVVNKLDISDAKRAGSFLDGCKVYLTGFTADMNEKLR